MNESFKSQIVEEKTLDPLYFQTLYLFYFLFIFLIYKVMGALTKAK